MNKNVLNYIKILSDNEQIQELLIKIIGKILLKQDNIEQFVKDNESKINHIRDWIVAIVKNNEQWKTPRVLNVDALNNIADKYFEKKNNKLQKIELDETHEKLIADLDDYYIVQMLTPQALDNESKQMQHCIGHGYYDQNLKDDEYQYLSLRDKFNKAHVTLEIQDNKILQLQGKQNKNPDIKYIEKMVPWLIKNNLFINRFGLVINKNDNKIYDTSNLPDNCEIDGNLSLRNSAVEKIPDNLIVNGDLDLSSCIYMQKLPENLTVNGKLNLRHCFQLTKLPDNLIVNGSLFIDHTNIKKLPENLIINGDLRLGNCYNITELPKNLNVNGDLYLNYTMIKELPQGIKIGKDLILNCSKIEKLPDNLIINGDLKIEDCKNLVKIPKGLVVKNRLSIYGMEHIEKIPEDTKFTDLDLSFSGIKTIDKTTYEGDLLLNGLEIENLPDNLTVKNGLYLMKIKSKKLPKGLKVGKLSLAFTNINELPDDIIVERDLYLSNSKITKLPDNLVVNGDLSLDECINIEELPNNLIVKGHLNLRKTIIKKLPSNLIVDGDLNLQLSQIEKLPDNLKIKELNVISCKNLKELPENIKILNDLLMEDSAIKKLPDNLKCRFICVTNKQINLIKESIEFREIRIRGKGIYTKEQFFETFYNKDMSNKIIL